MKSEHKMQIKFWGVRGSYPQSGPQFVRTGGHTSCVSLNIEDELIVFDAGTGLINLGQWIVDNKKEFSAIHFMLSHFHLDHIFGLPFFLPIWNKNSNLHFHSGIAGEFGGTYASLRAIFSPPYFPVPWGDFAKKFVYDDFVVGQAISTKKISIQTIALDHPGGGSGYRINHQGKSMVYLSDTSHEPKVFETYIPFARGADVLVYDATFTCKEFEKHPDWGHSTWRKAIELAQLSGVNSLVLFHHDPSHSDDFMDAIEQEAQVLFPKTIVAREGLELIL